MSMKWVGVLIIRFTVTLTPTARKSTLRSQRVYIRLELHPYDHYLDTVEGF